MQVKFVKSVGLAGTPQVATSCTMVEIQVNTIEDLAEHAEKFFGEKAKSIVVKAQSLRATNATEISFKHEALVIVLLDEFLYQNFKDEFEIQLQTKLRQAIIDYSKSPL